MTNYNANDQLATDAYDANGNASGVKTGTNGYVYDFENRLIQQGGISIVYDGDGNRVSKTVAGITTSYFVSNLNPTGYAQVLSESYSGGGFSPNKEFSHSYVYGLELISQNPVFLANGSYGTQTSYYVYDGHGSVRAVADPSGAATEYTVTCRGDRSRAASTTPGVG